MENSSDDLTPAAAADMLAAADASRNALANRLVLPPFLLPILGGAVAVQIMTAAAVWVPWGFILTLAGGALYLVVALLQVRRFRRANGVSIGGFTSRVVGGTATEATVSYLLGLAGALWAGYSGVWWVVPICAVAGGVGFAVSGARWVRVYRADPATHSRGESAVLLAVLGALAAAGIVLLLVAH